ncbi:BTB/POZ domain-containing protein 3 [Lepeophtheirus salmonis]|uniref:BTB/POZ domain-containing protein 3 n=1 Tax=Lepeophtheirus salmonis TaxID=72036 RepID=UPI001AE9EDAD|nr:BTB/POZ domain-containing protein 3-like [Lepeophtheirus salmonis]
MMMTPFKRRFKNIFEEGYFSDVCFLVGAGKNESVEKIAAHRCILVSISPVFENMFCGECKELKINDVEIKVPDVRPSTFKCMLEWIYTEEIDLNVDNVLSILYCAYKYDLSELNNKCIHFLSNNVKPKNLCQLMVDAKENHLYELIPWIKNRIGINATESLTSDSFLAIKDNELVKDILSNDILYLEEAQVFEFAVSWAYAQKKSEEKSFKDLRKCLGPAFNSIRFPLFSSTQFIEHILPLKLLNSQEVLEILDFIYKKQKAPSSTFSFEPRLRLLKRFKSIAVGSYVDMSHFLEFTVSERIKIHGYGIFRPTKRRTHFIGSIVLEFPSKKKILGLENFDLKLEKDPNSMTTINFDQPIKVYPKNMYRASLFFAQEFPIREVCFFVGKEGQDKMTADGVEFNFMGNTSGIRDTNVRKGQFPGIFFSRIP